MKNGPQLFNEKVHVWQFGKFNRCNENNSLVLNKKKFSLPPSFFEVFAFLIFVVALSFAWWARKQKKMRARGPWIQGETYGNHHYAWFQRLRLTLMVVALFQSLSVLQYDSANTSIPSFFDVFETLSDFLVLVMLVTILNRILSTHYAVLGESKPIWPLIIQGIMIVVYTLFCLITIIWSLQHINDAISKKSKQISGDKVFEFSNGLYQVTFALFFILMFAYIWVLRSNSIESFKFQRDA
ncbi:hypothetical protein RFI_15870, partial [Reticulomyxa filosa]